jgi:hypothetical protein
LKNPVATAPGSELLHPDLSRQERTTNDEQRSTNHEGAVRRQLVDDIMKRRSGVMGIFPIRRGFPETTRLSRIDLVFSMCRGFPGTARFSRKSVIFSMRRRL